MLAPSGAPETWASDCDIDVKKPSRGAVVNGGGKEAFSFPFARDGVEVGSPSLPFPLIGAVTPLFRPLSFFVLSLWTIAG